MPKFDSAFWVQLIVYTASFAFAWGKVTQRLKMLEQKVDKHNNVVERMAVAERDIKTLWIRTDEIKSEIKEI